MYLCIYLSIHSSIIVNYNYQSVLSQACIENTATSYCHAYTLFTCSTGKLDSGYSILSSLKIEILRFFQLLTNCCNQRKMSPVCKLYFCTQLFFLKYKAGKYCQIFFENPCQSFQFYVLFYFLKAIISFVDPNWRLTAVVNRN